MQLGILVACLLMSAFFSGSETGLMSLNRYRLKHLRKRNRGAKLALDLEGGLGDRGFEIDVRAGGEKDVVAPLLVQQR